MFLLLAGTIFPILAFALSDSFLSFPPDLSLSAKRVLFLLTGIWVFCMGIGFVRRKVWALRSFVFYVQFGTTMHLVLAMADLQSRWLLCSPFINVPIGIVVYWATHAAFVADGTQLQ